MRAAKFVIGAVVIAAAAAGGWTYLQSSRDSALRIYGSVDMRTVDLAFEESGRIDQVLVEEGASVKAGETVALLEMTRYKIARDTAQANLNLSIKELDLYLAGSRAEEIDSARATWLATKAAGELAERICRRERTLGQATTKQMIDQACSEARVQKSQADAAKKNLDLLLAGTRIEQIDVARASVEVAKTTLADAERALSNCTLKAPSDGVIRSRLKEKGDIVGSSAPVYELALMNPMWVRAWIDEINLGRIAMGDKVKVTVDSFPDEVFEGTVGFVSTVAEFTPKTVQTEAVRTSLVYEVRVTVEGEAVKKLRLGMPATVELSR